MIKTTQKMSDNDYNDYNYKQQLQLIKKIHIISGAKLLPDDYNNKL